MNKFTINLSIVGDLKPYRRLEQPDYDPEYDDINSIFSDVCDVLSEMDIVQFRVDGFGQDWPVDISTDLLCVLEQLKEIIELLLAEDYNFALDFYEQGIERRLEFTANDGLVEVVCRSATDWQPSPDRIVIEKEEVKRSFIDLRTTFCSIVHEVFPFIGEHPWFAEWEKVGGKSA